MAGYGIVIVVLFFVLYLVAGSLMLRRWGRGSRWQSRPDFHTDPNGWLSLWLPQLIAMELVVWFGAAIMCLLIVLLSPIMHSADAPYAALGFSIGVSGSAVFFVAVDVALVVRIRALADRSRRSDPAQPDV